MPAPPKLAVTYIPVANLQPFHRNPHKGNVARIRGSLRDHAQFKPVVVNIGTHTGRPNEVLCGNHTLLAAREEGWPELGATTVDVGDDEAAQINLIDNPRANHPEDLDYDDRLLLELLADLPDLDGSGYDLGDFTALEKTQRDQGSGGGAHDDDEVPDPPAEPVTVLGDLWELGPHRLLCGDALHPAQVDLVTDGVVPGVVYSDPPYGINAVPKDGGVSRGGPFGVVKKGNAGMRIPATKYEQVAGDENSDVARTAFQFLTSLYPEAKQIWWGGNHYASSVGLPDSSCWLVWDKDNGASDFADAELAWTNHKGAVRLLRHMWNGMLRATERGKRVHPTQKPVALAVWAFTAVHAPPGTPVLDVFAGSGSTLIAAHETGRQALLMELSPAYCDVICHRYQQATGTKPVRDGRPHDFTRD